MFKKLIFKIKSIFFFWRLKRLKNHGIDVKDLKRCVRSTFDLERMKRPDMSYMEYLKNGF